MGKYKFLPYTVPFEENGDKNVGKNIDSTNNFDFQDNIEETNANTGRIESPFMHKTVELQFVFDHEYTSWSLSKQSTFMLQPASTLLGYVIN